MAASSRRGVRGRARDGSPAVTRPRPFRYWRDPCCEVGGALYLLHRVFAPHLARPGGWWQGQGADVLLVPVGVPLWLWIERHLGWRTHDQRPTVSEVVGIGAIWAVAAEGVAPVLFRGATRDPRDLLAYALGAGIALMVWRMP